MQNNINKVQVNQPEKEKEGETFGKIFEMIEEKKVQPSRQLFEPEL